MQRGLQRVEHLDAHAQALREALGAAGHHHELLEVHAVIRVGAAVEHVHHRHRQHAGVRPTEVAPQRQTLLGGLGVRRRERDAEDRVGAQPRLVGGAVELDQRLVERALVAGVQAAHRVGDLTVHARHRAAHALPDPALPAVAQLGGLELARGGPGGDRRVAVRAGAQGDLHLDRRVAPAVEDLAGVDSVDLTQELDEPATRWGWRPGRSAWSSEPCTAGSAASRSPRGIRCATSTSFRIP